MIERQKKLTWLNPELGDSYSAPPRNPIRQEIKKITGVEVRESAAEWETANGIAYKLSRRERIVQIFLLAEKVAASKIRKHSLKQEIFAAIEKPLSRSSGHYAA